MIDIVRQPNDESCWSACVSTLTGMPIDALPLTGDSQVEAVRLVGPEGEVYLPATDDVLEMVRGWGEEVPKQLVGLGDWTRAFDGRFVFEGWTDWNGNRGILLVAMYFDEGRVEGHAVVIDDDGILYDPADGAFERINIDKVYRACNAEVIGFVEVLHG